MKDNDMADIRKSIKRGINEAGKGLTHTVSEIGSKAGEATGVVGDKLGDIRDMSAGAFKQAGDGLSAVIRNITTAENNNKEDESPAKELDEYEVAIVEYNQAYTFMSDNGANLHQERVRSSDLLSLIETLINSIANTPEEYDKTFAEIEAERSAFTSAGQYAKAKLDAARQSAMSAGGGIAAGAAVASIAPSAAIWIATTFGTASTGTAISTLSGAAASQAALAWLGGGAVAAGGAGTAGGSALLALAGPLGWGIAGATLLTSIVLFARKNMKLKKQKQDELLDIKRNTASVEKMNEQIKDMMERTASLRESLNKDFTESLRLYESDYSTLKEDSKIRLGSLVNNSKSLAQLLTKDVEFCE